MSRHSRRLREAAAADPTVREQWRNNAVINRHEETKIFVTHLAELVELPEGLDIERTTDVLWTYASFETAEALIVERAGHQTTTKGGRRRRSAESSASTDATTHDHSIPSRAKCTRSTAIVAGSARLIVTTDDLHAELFAGGSSPRSR